MEDRVQLKQEEVVDNEIVLKDINPKSSTKSIDDSATGASLNETLDRMWNAINNKLSRIVNSVNGRTGVVVLTSSDVGLGDVNNVSFADIKQWVIDRLIDEFGNKRIKLLNSFDDLDDILIKNDKKDRNSAYFIEKLNNVDTRSYIGYIYLDESADKLSYMQMPINTIGKTDDSIIYNEKVGNVDMMYGGIAVNINKAVEETNRVVDNGNMISSKFSNLSGLYVVRSHTVLEPQSIGFKGTASAGDTTTSLGETTNGPAFGKTLMSGGLAVNVGKFLDISPNGYPTEASSFHDGESGKVNVRIGKGLTDDGNNFISINTGDGTELDSEGKLKIKADNPFNIKHINVLNVGSAGIGVIIANNKGLFDEQLTTGRHSIAIKINETYVDEQPNNIHEGLFFDSDGYLRCPIDNNKGLSMDTSAVPSADSTGLYIKAGRGLTFYNGKHVQGTDPEVGSLEVDPVTLVELIKNDSTALAALKSALGLV